MFLIPLKMHDFLIELYIQLLCMLTMCWGGSRTRKNLINSGMYFKTPSKVFSIKTRPKSSELMNQESVP